MNDDDITYMIYAAHTGSTIGIFYLNKEKDIEYKNLCAGNPYINGLVSATYFGASESYDRVYGKVYGIRGTHQ